MVAAFACPVALASAATFDVPWGFALAPALALLLVIAIDLLVGPAAGARPGWAAITAGGSPNGYWLAWTFLVAVIAVEFSIVSLGVRPSSSDGPGSSSQRRNLWMFLGGLFLGGMFVGRFLQNLGLGTGGDLRRPAAIGVALARRSAPRSRGCRPRQLLSGMALFVAGLGVAGLYPLGVAAALAAAPWTADSCRRAVHAGDRDGSPRRRRSRWDWSPTCSRGGDRRGPG